MAKYIMALDAGTTSNRCILFNEQGEMCSVAQKEFTQYFPQPGWVEHDANEIWSTQIEVAQRAMANIGATAADIAAIGITNQRETTIVWDRKTGEPVCRAIVWQCRRTSAYCDELKEKGLVEEFRGKTGLVIDAYFSGTKLRWILENVPGVRARAERGELLFGTVETWLIWKLTGGKAHVTDFSNASRTMLFNINTLRWDDEILAELDIPGRPAGGAVRSDLLPAGRSQKYLRHRLLYADEYRRKARVQRKRAGHDDCMGLERTGHLRAGRLDFCGGGGDSVAAGRDAAH